MHRFFSTISLKEDILSFPSWNELFHQIVHVFRSKKGQKIIFFEENWPDIVYEVEQISKKNITFKKIEFSYCNKDKNRRPDITLFQSYPNKLSTLELLVQKIVEIGVQKLVLFPSQYSQMSCIPPHKNQRILTIAREAMEQSWDNSLLLIQELSDIKTAKAEYSDLTHIIASPDGSAVAPDYTQSLWLWIWPEWGWSNEEMDFFREEDSTLWSFNQNILRLETAAIVGVGILTYWNLFS